MAMKMTLAVVALGMAIGTGAAMAQNGGVNSGAQQQQPGGAQPNSTNQPGGMNQPGGINSMNQNGTASMQDKMFLRQASEGDQFEIQSAQLALQKSNSEDVKQFAQMMITDHTRLDNDMKPIAEQAGVQPATSLMGKQKKAYAKLEGLSGTAFDQQYIKDMVMDHKKVDKAFANEAGNGTLPSEKEAAATNKPTIDMHLQKAEALAQAHNVTMAGM